ncbi:tol-Pal system protein TolA-like [Hetaerina americana]|uniref:tol-Pal system protein TolA-like n=1 Tax=Hetaerina americana TaxID=62018 RepID=UPI003A7F1787
MFPAKPLNTPLLLLPLILALSDLTSASPILTLRPRQSSQPVFGTGRYRRSPSSGQLSAADHLRLSSSLSLPQLYSAGPRLRPVLPAPTFRQWDPVDPYRAFVEQELLEQPEQGGLQDSMDDAYYAESPYEGRAATRMSTETGQSPPFVLSPGYLQYNPAVSAFRPATTSWRSQERWRGPPGDPVDDLEEEMRREEDSMGWGTPRWSGGDDSDADEEDEDMEAEEEAAAEAEAEEEAERRRQAEEEAERAKTEGAFLRNLILAQRYREDALSQPEVGIGGRKAYRLSGGSKRTAPSGRRSHQVAEPAADRAVRELESLAGKGPSEKRSSAKGKAAAAVATTPSAPTEAPVRSTSAAPLGAANGVSGGQKGQKEVAVPRPASPPRRPPVESLGGNGGKWGKEPVVTGGSSSSKGSVLEALERLLEQEREPMRHRLVGSGHLQKRFVSGEDIMLRQLNELKRA